MRAKLPTSITPTTIAHPHRLPSPRSPFPSPWTLPNKPTHPPPIPTSTRPFTTTPSPQKRSGGKQESKRTVPLNAAKTAHLDPFDFSDYHAAIARAHDHLKSELAKIRTGGGGRNAVEGIERLRVKLLLMGRGETVGLGDVASVVARGRNVGVVVGERDHLKPVLSALASSPDSLNPIASPTDPLTLSIPIPPTTAESRQAAKELAGKKGEEALFALREARGAQRKRHRAMELGKVVGPDESRRAEKEVEKVNEGAVKEAKGLVEGCRRGLEGG